MAQYSLFVLKVPLNTDQPTNQFSCNNPEKGCKNRPALIFQTPGGPGLTWYGSHKVSSVILEWFLKN